jgi:hypothetical protein
LLPAIALTVLAMLYAPANGERAGECGPAVRIADPGIRASFAQLERRQSRIRASESRIDRRFALAAACAQA